MENQTAGGKNPGALPREPEPFNEIKEIRTGPLMRAAQIKFGIACPVVGYYVSAHDWLGAIVMAIFYLVSMSLMVAAVHFTTRR